MTSKNNTMRVTLNDLLRFEPLTAAQHQAYQYWNQGDNLVLAGSAGTGKTFLALLMAFEHVLSESTPAERVIVMRSAVPTREIGFMPGTKEEKEEPFMAPYKGLCKELFRDDGQAYHKMLKNGQLVFETTSFIRGQTFNNAVIVVDEMQNFNFHELDSVITRAGKNTRLIFSGDYYQSDFVKSTDKMGLYKFIEILDHMAGFEQVQFKWTDIIRSDLVRDYIMTKEMLGFR